MQREVEELHASLDSEAKGRGDLDRIAKNLELQVKHRLSFLLYSDMGI
jgi:hypothetical protein